MKSECLVLPFSSDLSRNFWNEIILDSRVRRDSDASIKEKEHTAGTRCQYQCSYNNTNNGSNKITKSTIDNHKNQNRIIYLCSRHFLCMNKPLNINIPKSLVKGWNVCLIKQHRVTRWAGMLQADLTEFYVLSE